MNASHVYVSKMLIRLLEKALDVDSGNRIKLSSTSTHFFNKCLHEAANIVEEHTFKKCSPYATAKHRSELDVSRPRHVSKHVFECLGLGMPIPRLGLAMPMPRLGLAMQMPRLGLAMPMPRLGLAMPMSRLGLGP